MGNGTPSISMQETPQYANAVQTSSRSTPSSTARFSQHETPEGDASDSDLEADSVLTSQATFATQFVQQALRNQPPNISAEVTSSLSALRRILLLQDERNSKTERTHDVQLISSTPTDLTLPDISLSMKAMQRLQESAHIRLFWTFEFDSIGQFTEYFFTAYSGKPSVAVLMIVNAGLGRLFTECSNVDSDPALSGEFKVHGAAICWRNLNAMLARLPTHTYA